MLRHSSYLTIALLSLVAAGCSTGGPESVAQNDPFEPTNRAVFDVNTKLDNNFAKPVAKFYNHAVPGFARTGLHNFLVNLDKPVTFGNDLLQGEGTRAGETLERFTVNSTLGVAGLIDTATYLGIPDHSEDFGQTLGVWGAEEGPFLMLLMMGPSNTRDLTGSGVDILLDPLTYIKFHGSDTWSAVRMGTGVLDLRARSVDTTEQMERTSIDFYATMRSLYRQYRNAEIHNGNPDDTQDIDTPAP